VILLKKGANSDPKSTETWLAFRQQFEPILQKSN
jgi:hypothetical protein